MTFYGANITQKVKDWYSGTANNGFMIRYTDESLTDPKYNSFYTCDSTLTGYYYPSITIVCGETTLSSETYFIKNKQTGKYLDIWNGNSTSGTKVWQYSYNGTLAQQWERIYVGNGVYEFAPGTSSGGLRLDISAGADLQNQSIQVYNKNNSAAQRWRILSNGDGSYRIMPEMSSTRVLSIRGGSGSDKDDAVLATYTGSSAQQWVFESVPRSLSMVHYYDEGYNLRITNASSAISGHQTVVKNKLEEIFPSLTVTPSVYSYRSNADTCKGTVTTSNLASSCSHSPNHLTSTAMIPSRIPQKKTFNSCFLRIRVNCLQI